MVERATSLNRYPAGCSYLVSNGERITAFEPDTFDFIYTSIVLQHMEPRFAVGYLRDFARLLRPGGTLVLQVPDKVNPGRTVGERLRLAWYRLKQAVGIRTRLARLLRRAGLVRRPPGVNEAAPEMHCVPEQLVCQTLESVGLRVIDIQLTNSTDLDFAGGLRYLTSEPSVGYVSKQYSVVKPR
jgi:SAM-dependent methyltransferase